MCTHPDLSAQPIYLVFVSRSGPVSGQWVCMILSDRWKTSEKDEKRRWTEEESSQPVWSSQPLQPSTRILYAQKCKPLIVTAFAPLPHPARPKSGLFMQAWFNKHCSELAQALALCRPNPSLYRRVEWSEKFSAVTLKSVYAFHIMALTHGGEHQTEVTVIYIYFFSCGWLQSPVRRSCIEDEAVVTLNKKNTQWRVCLYLTRGLLFYISFKCRLPPFNNERIK